MISRVIIALNFAMIIPAVNAQYLTYDVSFYSYAQFSTSGEASIDLYNEDQKQIGILIFLPIDANLLPVAYQDPNDGLVRLYYTATGLQSIIDLLRYESPIVLNYWLPNGNNSHIASKDFERVGESE